MWLVVIVIIGLFIARRNNTAMTSVPTTSPLPSPAAPTLSQSQYFQGINNYSPPTIGPSQAPLYGGTTVTLPAVGTGGPSFSTTPASLPTRRPIAPSRRH